MAAPGEFLERRGSESIFDRQRAPFDETWSERRGEMHIVEHRGVNRFLQIEPVMEMAQQQQKCPLVLLVAAGRAAREIRFASLSTRVGERVVRGRAPGIRLDGNPSTSQNIWARVPSGKPSSGITGELWNQPPLGVAVIILPQRSIKSRWTVSP